MAEQYITPPEGFELPAEEGAEVDVSVRCKREGDKLCVVKMNGIPVGEGKEMEKPDADERTEEKMKGMSPSEAGMAAGY